MFTRRRARLRHRTESKKPFVVSPRAPRLRVSPQFRWTRPGSRGAAESRRTNVRKSAVASRQPASGKTPTARDSSTLCWTARSALSPSQLVGVHAASPPKTTQNHPLKHAKTPFSKSKQLELSFRTWLPSSRNLKLQAVLCGPLRYLCAPLRHLLLLTAAYAQRDAEVAQRYAEKNNKVNGGRR